MSEGKRPGGLTALAVLNFIFGGFDALGVLGLLALVGAANEVTKAHVPGTGIVLLLVLLLGLSAVLLIASGVGYIKQKQFLGRTLGNAYGILALIETIVSLVALHKGFGITNIIGLIYPVLTLILLNTTFKEDFVN